MKTNMTPPSENSNIFPTYKEQEKGTRVTGFLTSLICSTFIFSKGISNRIIPKSHYFALIN